MKNKQKEWHPATKPLRKETARPNFHIHVSESDLNIPSGRPSMSPPPSSFSLFLLYLEAPLSTMWIKLLAISCIVDRGVVTQQHLQLTPLRR